MINFNPLISVADTMFGLSNQKLNPHAYLSIENNRLALVQDKKHASSLLTITDFIRNLKGKFATEQDKSLVCLSWKKIQRSYLEKHGGIIARIIRFFSLFYRNLYKQTCNQLVETECFISKIAIEEKRTARLRDDPITAEPKPIEPPKIIRTAVTDKEQESATVDPKPADPSKIIRATRTEAEKGPELDALFKKATEQRIEQAQKLLSTSIWSKIPTLLKDDLHLGVRIQKIGASIFKHQALAFQSKTFTDGAAKLFVTGSMSRPKGLEVRKSLENILKNPILFFKTLPEGFCQAISAKKEKAFFPKKTEKDKILFNGNFSASDGYQVDSEIYRLDFLGLGTVSVGRQGTLKDRIEIKCDASLSVEEAAKKIPILLASLGLEEALLSSSNNDVERLKLMQLFRIYYPKKAYYFENEALTFTETLDSLKNRIIDAVPEMKERIENQLGQMYQQEVYPGHSIWAVKGLAKEVENAGGTCLMSGIKQLKYLPSILKKGVLSTLDRFEAGLIIEGESCGEDFKKGGADSVFARLLTSTMTRDPKEYELHGQAQILCDLSLLERGGYAYSSDYYGSKAPIYHKARLDILSLTKLYQADPENHLQNEVCIRNRIPPQYIKGLVVKNQTVKNQLIQEFTKEGIIKKNAMQLDCINGILVDEFFHVGKMRI